MKFSQVFLATLVSAQEGSGEETQVLTSNYEVEICISSDAFGDLSLRSNQMALENVLNDPTVDKVFYKDLTYNKKTADSRQQRSINSDQQSEAIEFTVAGTAFLTDDTELSAELFGQAADTALAAELKSINAGCISVVALGVSSQSCSDGQNGGCSHFCTDNKCSCPNCWTLGGDMKSCAPAPGTVTITCDATSMSLDISECVLEDNSGFKLDDDVCEPTLTDGVWSVTSDLDGCGTEFDLDDDSQIITFSNKLTAAPEINNGIIMSRSLGMDFECQYGTTYDDVSNNRTIMGGTVDIFAGTQEGTFGTGSLGFALNFYTASDYETLVDKNSLIMVGETLFFSIESATSIDGLVFTVLDCTVSDPNLGAEYDILTGQCADPYVGTAMLSDDPLADAAMLKYSYTAFQFAGVIGTESEEKLSCSVLVCESGNSSTPCGSTPTCGSRKRRSEEIDGQVFYVSSTFTLKK